MNTQRWFDNDNRLIDLLRASVSPCEMGSRKSSSFGSLMSSARDESYEYWDRILSDQGMDSPQPSGVDSEAVFGKDDLRSMKLADEAEVSFFPKGKLHGKSRNTVTKHVEDTSMGDVVDSPIAEPLQKGGGVIPTFNPEAILKIVRQVTSLWNAKEFQFYATGKGLSPLNTADIAHLSAAYDHMLWMFHQNPFPAKYDPHATRENNWATSHSTTPASFPLGSPIPSYYANVVSETIHYRKVLSIAGLRNLLSCGPSLFKEFAAGMYCHALCGPVLDNMRTATGNVVDLDTVVLRCSSTATLQVINASNRHKGLPQFSSTSTFGNSKQAKEIAINCAHRCLEEFKTAIHITDTDMKRRKSALSDLPSVDSEGSIVGAINIPVATNNADRGNAPLWRYNNAGQDSYHANAPVLDDIFGALIRAPVMCVHHYALLFSGVYDNPTAVRLPYEGCAPALQQKLRAFFEDCVADSCFNMKWKSIEMFGQILENEGSIQHVLAELQMRNQGMFTSEIFDADEANGNRDLEASALWNLATGLRGKDKGKIRPITAADVNAFVSLN